MEYKIPVLTTVFYTLALFIPLIILVYFFIRLRYRRESLLAKIFELKLEKEYLYVFHYSDWNELKALPDDTLTGRFRGIFNSRFQSDNNFKNYVIPFIFTLITNSLVSFLFYEVMILNAQYKFINSQTLVYSFAGALLYVFPTYIAKYSNLSLTPSAIYRSLGSFWLSTLIGFAVASIVTEDLKLIAAFLGAYLPLSSMDFIKEKIFAGKKEEEDLNTKQMLEIVHDDKDLCSQLNYAGIRSVLTLAYENPLKIFVETDLNIIVSIDVVDQANLYLYVPDKDTRVKLGHYGIRTAIDLVTQLYIELPNANGEPEQRFLKLEEDLPAYLQKSMEGISAAMGLNNVEELRNIIDMMVENPQLIYLLNFWERVTNRAELKN